MTDKVLVASVAVENSVFHFDREYSYIVPENVAVNDLSGFRVLVPFSKSNRRLQGYVLGCHYEQAKNTADYKEIIKLLDSSPLLTDEMIKLAYFMKDRCFCTLYDAIKAMLPAGINYKVKTVYMYNGAFDLSSSVLTSEQRRILDYVKNNGSVTKEKLFEDFGLSESCPPLEELIKSGAVISDDSAFRKIKDASQKMVRLKTSADELKLTPKQREITDVLNTAGEVSLKELCYFTGITKAVCDNLEKKGIIEYFSAEVFRTPKSSSGAANSGKIILTDEQLSAYKNLLKLYESNKPAVSLLYGVTGSGKTSVFMSLIDKAYSDGKGVIVMVPEIALTPQMLNIFTARYGSDVAVFHSGLSLGERLDEWKRVRQGKAKIAVGTRSAVFAPFENLGLIIMDEEQEYTYKSESNPRYHAKELAKYRCVNNNCLLLLSSATPSVESYYKAKTGVYSLSVLKNRYGQAKLPDVLTADMNIETEQGNFTGYSSVLLEALEQNLSDGMQSILLMNRRGHNTFVVCRDCKEAVSCPNCSISLTYHSANNRLMCHYCGYSQPVTANCPLCGSSRLKFSGMGTQKAEQSLCELLPEAKILRLDADATMTKNSHARLLTAFANGEYDIMIGTQMVAKGLDFPNVTLVGVLNADQMLYADDFRSYERAFSLLTQVVGRSGRGKHSGRAVIQTMTPENPIIYLAAEQNYDAFYKSDIGIRKAMLYPPFADICMVGFVGDNDKTALNAAKAFTNRLCKTAAEKYPQIPLRVIGPSCAAVKKVSNKYRYKLILKFKNSKSFREMLSRLLIEFGKDSKYRSVAIFADINPDTIL